MPPLPASIEMSAANRVRRLVATWGHVLAAVLLLVSLVAFAGAWSAYSDPVVTTVTEEQNPQSFSTELNTSAVVTGNTTLYDAGERLVNKPVYLFSASPELTLSVVTSAPDGTAVTQRLVLHLQASRAGEVFWEREQLLAFGDGEARNGELVSETTINMSEARREISTVQSAIGDVGTFSSQLRLTVSYESDRYAGDLESASPVVIAGAGYWLANDMSTSRSHSETVTRRVTRPPDVSTYGGFVLLGLLALGGAGAVFYLRTRGFDVTALETELAHERYEEWISEGEFPTDSSKRYVRINTLEDLVDIAIDSNKRVVHDEEIAAYGMVDGDLVYYYTADPRSLDAWLDI